MAAAEPHASTLIDGDGACNAFPGYAVAGHAMLAFYRKGVGHLSSGGRLYVARSRDDGATWEHELLVGPCGETGGVANDDIRDAGAAQMDTGFPGGGGAFEAAPIEFADGRLLVPGHGADDAGEPLYIRVLESRDRGETWSDTGAALRSSAGNEWNEPWACPVGDGRVLLLIRDETDYIAKASWSSDGGRTWSDPAPALPACNSRPACLALPGGKLLALYRQERDSAGGASDLWFVRFAVGPG
jgi:hypothetical protein